MGVLFLLLVVTWAILAVASLSLFRRTRDVAFRRRVFPWFVAASAALFLGLVALIGAPRDYLLLMLPPVAVVAFFNVRGTRFCSTCGRTVHGRLGVTPPRSCSHCGAHLGGR